MTEEEQELRRRLAVAEDAVAEARKSGDKRKLADTLRALGNIQRRPPWLRDDANQTYAEAAEIYHSLDLPLDAAVFRDVSIRHAGEGLLIAQRR